MSMRRNPFPLTVAGLALALAASACGGDEDRSSGGGGVSGDIVISGSSTVQPISVGVAERFSEENPDVNISVDGPGTGDGFALFCNGETDVSDASRPIEDEEASSCEANGIEYVELEIAFDGITVMTNPANSAVECLDFKDLYALIGPESEGFEAWSDANVLGEEIGAGHAPYPDAPLVIVGPGDESGTYDAFIELALTDVIEERGSEEATRPDYQDTPNDNVIIQGIEGSDTSLGWVGFAFAEDAGDQIKEVQVDGGGGCVGPARDTIAGGSYPISRSLYIYVNRETATSDAALKAFVDFYLTDVGVREAVTEAGYVDLPADRIEATRSTWEGARV
jgi:phosphate transport system substrate-binding protein